MATDTVAADGSGPRTLPPLRRLSAAAGGDVPTGVEAVAGEHATEAVPSGDGRRPRHLRTSSITSIRRTLAWLREVLALGTAAAVSPLLRGRRSCRRRARARVSQAVSALCSGPRRNPGRHRPRKHAADARSGQSWSMSLALTRGRVEQPAAGVKRVSLPWVRRDERHRRYRAHRRAKPRGVPRRPVQAPGRRQPGGAGRERLPGTARLRAAAERRRRDGRREHDRRPGFVAWSRTTSCGSRTQAVR